MNNFNTLIDLFQNITNPQCIKQATNDLIQFRQREGFFIAVMNILKEHVNIKEEIKFCAIIELKNYLNTKKLDQGQLLEIQQNIITIIVNQCTAKNHKMMRQIIKILTYKYNGVWLRADQLVSSIESKYNNYQPKSNFCWVLSALIGIPQGYPHHHLHNTQEMPKLEYFQSIFYSLLKKASECSFSQLDFIMQFIYRFVYSSNVQYTQQLLGKYLNYLCCIGKKLWQVFNPQNQQQSQNQKENITSQLNSQFYFLQIINESLVKQQTYMNKINNAYRFEIWQHQVVARLIKQLLMSLTKLKDKLLYLVIKIINSYIKCVKPLFILNSVQQLLYFTLPKLLFGLRQIILSNGQPISCQMQQQYSIQIKLKQSILQLWRNLSYIDLTNFRNILGQKITKWDNSRKIQNQLTAYAFHFKFVFQKLSQTDTLFGPFLNKTDLQLKNCWDSKNKQWIIVAFDLLKALQPDLIFNSQNQEFKKSMPSILLMYIIPKLSSQNQLIQNHAFSVLSTFHNDFLNVFISPSALSSIQNLILNCTGRNNLALKILPNIWTNKQILYLISSKLKQILDVYIKVIFENGDQQIVQGIDTIIKLCSYKLKNPQQYFIRILDSFLMINYKQVNVLERGIIELIHIFIGLKFRFENKEQQNHQKLLANMYKIVDFSLVENQNLDFQEAIVQQQLLIIVANFVARQQIPQNFIFIFLIYCLSLSGNSQNLTNLMKNKQTLKQLQNYIYDKKLITFKQVDQNVVNIVWILHAFSIKQDFYEHSQIIGNKPIVIYICALLQCLHKFQTNKQQYLQQYFDLIDVILYGLTYVMEEFFILQHNNDSLIFTQIWTLVYQQIYCKNKLAIINTYKPKQQQKNINLTDQYFGNRIKKRLVQLWSTMLWVCPVFCQVSFSQFDGLIGQYFRMIQNSTSYDLKNKGYRKRVILGFASLLQTSLSKSINQQIFKIMYEMVSVNVNIQKYFFDTADNLQQKHQNSDQQQQLQQINQIQQIQFEQGNNNKYFSFNIQKVKQSPFQQIQEIQLLNQSLIWVKQQNHKFYKLHKKKFKKLESKIGQLSFQGLYL